MLVPVAHPVGAVELRPDVPQQAETHQVEDGGRFTWSPPQPFPRGVMLKTRVRPGGRCRVFQRGHELHPDKRGVYSVSFDAGELVLRGGL